MVAEFLMLEVIQFWFGGYMCFFLGVYSYISDISNEKTRTVRIALLDFVFYTGLAAGEGEKFGIQKSKIYYFFLLNCPLILSVPTFFKRCSLPLEKQS